MIKNYSYIGYVILRFVFWIIYGKFYQKTNNVKLSLKFLFLKLAWKFH